MRFVLRVVAGMKAIEIPDIETTQHAPLSRGTREVVFICALNHCSFQSSLHVDAAGAEGSDQRLPHRIFVEVETYHHGMGRGRADCVSRCVASASSAAMSASISSRLA